MVVVGGGWWVPGVGGGAGGGHAPLWVEGGRWGPCCFGWKVVAGPRAALGGRWSLGPALLWVEGVHWGRRCSGGTGSRCGLCARAHLFTASAVQCHAARAKRERGGRRLPRRPPPRASPAWALGPASRARRQLPPGVAGRACSGWEACHRCAGELASLGGVLLLRKALHRCAGVVLHRAPRRCRRAGGSGWEARHWCGRARVARRGASAGEALCRCADVLLPRERRALATALLLPAGCAPAAEARHRCAVCSRFTGTASLPPCALPGGGPSAAEARCGCVVRSRFWGGTPLPPGALPGEARHRRCAGTALVVAGRAAGRGWLCCAGVARRGWLCCAGVAVRAPRRLLPGALPGEARHRRCAGTALVVAGRAARRGWLCCARVARRGWLCCAGVARRGWLCCAGVAAWAGLHPRRRGPAAVCALPGRDVAWGAEQQQRPRG